MKKILFVLGCICAVYSGTAFGACTMVSGRGSSIKGNDALNLDAGGHYVCGENMCGNGETVGVLGGASIGSKAQGTMNLYRCNAGGTFHDDTWELVGDLPECSGALGNVDHSHPVMIKGGNSGVGSNACYKYECDSGYTEKYDGNSHQCYTSEFVCNGSEVQTGKCKWHNDSHAKSCERRCNNYGLWTEKITECLGLTEPNADGSACVDKVENGCYAKFGSYEASGEFNETQPIACNILEVYESSSIDGYESGGYGWEYAKTCEIWCQANETWRGRIVSCDESIAERQGGACKLKEKNGEGLDDSGVNITIINDGSANVSDSGNSSTVNDNQNAERTTTTVTGDGNSNVGNSNNGSNSTGDRSIVGNSNTGNNNTGDNNIVNQPADEEESEKPEKPAEQTTPGEPNKPAEPRKPNKPAKPTTPNKPTKPTIPEVPAEPVVPQVQWNCPAVIVAGDWQSKYVECPDLVVAIEDLRSYCASSGRNEEGFNERNSRMQRLKAQCEKQLSEAARKQRVTKSSAAIENASKKLDEIMAGLKISVWKTSEGNFNGARLASDSIAGVVLGTAGGLITSNVVKKNQVKTGFEDISCTVGGQRVADWGDEFTVGIH